MKDGTQFVGRPMFCYGEDYSKLPKGPDMVYCHIILVKDVPRHYHVGGETKFIILLDLLDIIVMNEAENADAKNYNNNAPLFINRLFGDE